MKTAVIYARSANVDGNIEQQIAICKNYAKTNEIKIKKVYVDKCVSGMNINRTSFNNMIKDFSKEKYDYVIVENISRISRDLKTMQVIRQKLAKKGIEIIAATETKTDRFLISWSEIAYQMFLDELTKRGMK